MPNVQWMSYSFVKLYLSKCDMCVLNHIWFNPKRFLIILYVFGSDFYYSLCSCLVFTLFFIVYFVFHYLNMFCIEKQVSEFFAAQLATRQSRNPSREFIQKFLATHSRLARKSLATRKNFHDWTSWLVTRGLLATRENFRDWTSRLAQSRNALK